MSFAIPDNLGRRFKKAVPAGQRSAIVTSLLLRKLRVREADLDLVCERVNRLAKLNEEMAEWERFDDADK